MQEYPDDKQMDELFRKSAEAFDPPYDPTAWQDMAARLDRHDQTTPSVWLRRGLTVLLLVWLTGNYGWFSSSRPLVARTAQSQYHKPISANEKNTHRTDNQQKIALAGTQSEQAAGRPKQLNNKVKQLATIDTDTESTVSLPLPQSANNQESAISTTRITPGIRPTTPDANRETVTKTPRVGQSTTQLTNPANLPANRPVSAGNNRANPRKQNQQAVGSNTSRTNRTMKNAFAFSLINPVPASGRALKTARPDRDNDARQPTPATPDGKLTSFQQPENNELASPGSPENQVIALLPIRDKLTELGRNRLTNSTVESPIQEMTHDTSQPMPTVKPLRPLRLVVGAVFSPDLSTIGLRNFERPGTNFGLSVQYQFSKRWSIQTGILQSQKIYRALPSQYQLPPNVKWEVPPSSIDGTCRMIDLPINVRYDLSLKSHPTGLFSSARWFVSAGATAYWINRETYQYNYDNPNDPAIRYRNWKTSTGRQGISNLNLSVGYERQLNRRFSVQAEPFVKMPLRNIGFFKIRLISTGVFMSVRYRF